jgi:hypothetical protein
MKRKIRYIAPLLVAAGIAAVTGLAPVAIADPNSGSGQNGTWQMLANRTASPPSTAPASNDSGGNPLVPADTGATPFVFMPPGYGLAS